MMLKVLFYSYLIGNMSCRKMEEGFQVRADYVFLSGDQVPDFRTLNTFRTRHMAELPGLFTQIVTLCAALGMVDFRNLAIDGQKIQANANFRNNVDHARAKKRLDRIRKGMEKLLEQEPNEMLSQETIDERKRRLERKEARLVRTLAVLETFEDEKVSVNMVDADAKIMSHKDRRILPSYNQQSAVDGTYGVTCAVSTTQTGDTPGDLFALVDAAAENAGKSFESVLADSGFPTMRPCAPWKRIGKRRSMFPTSDRKSLTTGRPLEANTTRAMSYTDFYGHGSIRHSEVRGKDERSKVV